MTEMEDLLQNIVKEASGKQLQNLKQAAQIAYGELCVCET